jgi:phage-related protein
MVVQTAIKQHKKRNVYETKMGFWRVKTHGLNNRSKTMQISVAFNVKALYLGALQAFLAWLTGKRALSDFAR